MQQFITSSEACALLDRVLKTVQSLNSALELYVTKPIIQAQPLPAPAENMAVLPAVERVVPAPKAPVLTIKLSDLIRESENVQRRNKQHARHRRSNHQPRHKRQAPNVEVVYRRSHRLAS
jgi:hypothetical protein